MKLLQLLKNRTGAISGTRALLAGVLVTSAALTVSSYFQNPTEPDPVEVRRLADLMTQHAELPPEYASISNSFSLGKYGGQFATAEENAKYNGQLFAGSDSADALESGNLMGQVFSGDNGLGLGNKDVDVSASTPTGNVVDPEGQARSAIKNVRGGQGGAGEGGTQTEKEDDGSKVNKLQNATITHANGNNLSSSGSGASSSVPGPRGVKTRPVNTTSVNPEANVISGSMGAGSSSLVKSNNRFVDPSYKPSRDDIKGHKNRTVRETTEKDFVKYVTQQSRKMARREKKAPNETVTTSLLQAGETTFAYDTGSEFNNPGFIETPDPNNGLDGDENLGEKAVETTDELAEYNHLKKLAQEHLLNMFLSLMGTVMAACMTIVTLMKTARAEMKVPATAAAGAAKMALAIAIGVITAGLTAVYMGFAGQYISFYPDETGVGWAHIAGGAAFLVFIGLAYLPGSSGKEGSGFLNLLAQTFGGGGVLTGGKELISEFNAAVDDGSFSPDTPESVKGETSEEKK